MVSGEDYFCLNGYVNKQNCRIWSRESHHAYKETPLYPKKITVWCTIDACGIFGPYFFENGQEEPVTSSLSKNLEWLFLLTCYWKPSEEFCFQQKVVTCHTAMALLVTRTIVDLKPISEMLFVRYQNKCVNNRMLHCQLSAESWCNKNKTLGRITMFIFNFILKS